jgi:hypothetical protein
MKSKKMVSALLVPLIFIGSSTSCGGGKETAGSSALSKLKKIEKEKFSQMSQEINSPLSQMREQMREQMSQMREQTNEDVDDALNELAPQLRAKGSSTETVLFEGREWKIDKGDDDIDGTERSGRFSLSQNKETGKVLQAYILLRRSNPLKNYTIIIKKNFSPRKGEVETGIIRESSNTLLGKALLAAGGAAVAAYLYNNLDAVRDWFAGPEKTGAESPSSTGWFGQTSK